MESSASQLSRFKKRPGSAMRLHKDLQSELSEVHIFCLKITLSTGHEPTKNKLTISAFSLNKM